MSLIGAGVIYNFADFIKWSEPNRFGRSNFFQLIVLGPGDELAERAEEFQGVPFQRIMAGRYGNPSGRFMIRDGQFDRRRRYDTDIDDITADHSQRRYDDLRIMQARRTAVAPDDDFPLLQKPPECRGILDDIFGSERFTDNSPNSRR